MRALKDSLIHLVYIPIDWSFISACTYKCKDMVLLLLYFKFLHRLPWFYAENEYLGANRSGGSPIMPTNVYVAYHLDIKY